MKISIAAITVAQIATTFLAGVPTAAAQGLDPVQITVQTYSDANCAKELETLTLNWKSDACGGRCRNTDAFKSFKVISKNGAPKHTFLYATAFTGDRTAPCNSFGLNNATSVDFTPRQCTPAYYQGKTTKIPAQSMRLEIASP